MVLVMELEGEAVFDAGYNHLLQLFEEIMILLVQSLAGHWVNSSAALMGTARILEAHVPKVLGVCMRKLITYMATCMHCSTMIVLGCILSLYMATYTTVPDFR
jgi:hypothetical protein